MRRFAPLALLLGAVPLLAAPVPEKVTHAKEFKAAFGTSHPPDAGCDFQFDGTTLTAKLSDQWVGSQHHPLECLHTDRAVTGDFEMTVTLRTTAPADPPAAAGKGAKRCDLGGGLAAWEPDAKDPTAAAKGEDGREKAVSVCRYYTFSGEPRRGEPRVWEKGNTASYPKTVYEGDTAEADPTEKIHLRLTRTGAKLTSASSADGETWKDIGSQSVEFADTLRVGVWAYNGTGHKYDVVFENYTLKPLK